MDPFLVPEISNEEIISIIYFYPSRETVLWINKKTCFVRFSHNLDNEVRKMGEMIDLYYIWRHETYAFILIFPPKEIAQTFLKWILMYEVNLITLQIENFL